MPNNLSNRPANNIEVVISSFHDGDELVKIKVTLHVLCIDFVKDLKFLHILT